MKPHKHAEMIKAWADGHTIEMFTADGCWMKVAHPSWRGDMEYRVKREPKPDVVENQLLFWNMGLPSTADTTDPYCNRWLKQGSAYGVVGKFKLTYDGETMKLKHVELAE